MNIQDRSRELLKAIFVTKNIKKQTGSAWNFLQPQYKYAELPQPYFKIISLFFCKLLVFKEYLIT